MYRVGYMNLYLNRKKNNIIGFFIGKKEIKNMVIDCIAIKRRWQRKSIGTKLMTFYFQKFLSSKDKVVAYAWKIKNKMPAGKINYKFGLKPVKNMGKICILQKHLTRKYLQLSQ